MEEFAKEIGKDKIEVYTRRSRWSGAWHDFEPRKQKGLSQFGSKKQIY